MAQDMKAILGLKKHIITDSYHMENSAPEGEHEVHVLRTDSLETFLEKVEPLLPIEGIFFFERFDWNRFVFDVCDKYNIKTVCIPMWEWFTGHIPDWKRCDLFVCPSQHTQDTVESYGFTNVALLPWLLDLQKFPARKITGKARTFIHNAGLVDIQDRKGTRDTINAFKKTTSPDIRLIVRLQREVDLPSLDERIEVQVGHLDNVADLFKQGDVAIQPSKMEGIGFMVLEAVCSGLPVITLDYPPMNDYVTQPDLLVKKKWFKRKSLPSNWVKHAHLRLPSISDLAKKIEWCAENELETISWENRTWAENEFNADSLRARWQDTLERSLV